MSVGGVSYVQGLDSGEQNYTHACTTLTAIGSTTVYTPSAGRKVQIRWVSAISDPSSSVQPLIQLFLGGDEKYRAYALAKRQLITGPTDGPLTMSLDKAGSVAVTVILEEVM